MHSDPVLFQRFLPASLAVRRLFFVCTACVVSTQPAENNTSSFFIAEDNLTSVFIA